MQGRSHQSAHACLANAHAHAGPPLLLPWRRPRLQTTRPTLSKFSLVRQQSRQQQQQQQQQQQPSRQLVRQLSNFSASSAGSGAPAPGPSVLRRLRWANRVAAGFGLLHGCRKWIRKPAACATTQTRLAQASHCMARLSQYPHLHACASAEAPSGAAAAAAAAPAAATPLRRTTAAGGAA